nr:integrase, catalytic region, zinc finger, CCHC-type, peptidase aspartic, catalytic [Tanacetum cinerariifolium]
MSLSLAENVIVAEADNRPSMLDKTRYSSWASRMLLYIKGKENGKLLIDSVINGPFQYGTVTELGTLTTPAIV